VFPERQPVKGKQMLDLPEANRRQLLAAGLLPEHIYDCGRCTACETELFFSYRREPEEPGRMTAAICRCA
jgi:copper oxidase (laccase) domain-containing protein